MLNFYGSFFTLVTNIFYAWSVVVLTTITLCFHFHTIRYDKVLASGTVSKFSINSNKSDPLSVIFGIKNNQFNLSLITHWPTFTWNVIKNRKPVIIISAAEGANTALLKRCISAHALFKHFWLKSLVWLMISHLLLMFFEVKCLIDAELYYSFKLREPSIQLPCTSLCCGWYEKNLSWFSVLNILQKGKC